MELKPYPTYKPAGVPWLQQVPEHWSEMKVKHIFRERVQKGYADEPLLAATQSKGVVTKEVYGLRTVEAQKDLHLLKLVEKGDFVISLRSFQGGIEISHSRGIISPAYTILRSARPCDAGYLKFLLKSAPFIDGLKLFITGIREGQNIDYSRLARTHLPWPRLEEQQSIAKYLQSLDAKVKRYIRTKRKLIAALQEQKQAIIQRAVTRGLDPNVKLKPSGVEWLGDVPVHWRLTRIKSEFQNLDRVRVPLSADVRGRMAKRIYDYYGASGVIDKVEDFLFDDQLLLIAEDGANLVLRNLRLVLIAQGKFWVNNHAHILKPKRGNIHYWAELLETLNYKPWITGAAQPKLTGDRLMGITLSAPDEFEQNAIVDFFMKATAPLTRTIEHEQIAVKHMLEYHTRLIADVVTGAVDVRAAAQALPVQPIDQTADEPMEEEPLSMAAEGEEAYENE